MKEGVIAAVKKHGVSEPTVYEWCKMAGVQPAKNTTVRDWSAIRNALTAKK